MSELTNILPLPPSTPGGHVDFNANFFLTTKMTGGYSGYQLWPNGNLVSPVAQKTTQPMTLAKVQSFFCYKADGYDLYLCEATADFNRDETVEIQGPINDPRNPARDFIQMTGLTSTKKVNFYLSTSTTDGGNNNPGSLGTVGFPVGQYTLTVTVEAAGQVVFSTKTKI